MFKVKILLGATLLMVVLSGTLASRAGLNHVIFTRDPISPNICNVPVFSKDMIPTPIGTFWATSIQGSTCVLALTYDFDD